MHGYPWQPLLARDNVAGLQAQVANNNTAWLFCSSHVLGAVSSVRRCQRQDQVLKAGTCVRCADIQNAMCSHKYALMLHKTVCVQLHHQY